MLDKKETRIEYDRFYRRKPTKWTSDDRDEYARVKIEDYLDGHPKTFLDVGCGCGHTIKYLSERWKATKFYGFDLSPVAINTARVSVPTADFQVAFLDEITYSLTFQVVCLSGVIEHFENIQASLQMIKALVSKNGIVYIEAPNCLDYPESKHVEGFRRVNFGNRQMEWHLTRGSWKEHFTKAGFKIGADIIGPTLTTEFVFIFEK
jgi:trans-aconitate methyltransferase